MLKIVFIYRKSRVGAHSIEELFHAIALELSTQVKIIEYTAGTRFSILMDAWRLRRLKADIYHVTGDIHYLVNLLPSNKTVLTVHDINHYLLNLKGIKHWLYKWLWLVFPIRSSSAVTTISVITRDNLINNLNVTKKHIELIENCYDNIFLPIEKPFNNTCPVILQIGTSTNKNIFRLIDALKGLSCRLILIGVLEEQVKNQLAECEITYENYVGLTHEEIYKWYVECDLVSFVSLNEGFGVPIIEAQVVGRPVVTSNILPVSDVAGAGACLVNPLNTIEIREAIKRIISDSSFRNQLVDDGFKNVIRYSPATISTKYLKLYERLVQT